MGGQGGAALISGVLTLAAAAPAGAAPVEWRAGISNPEIFACKVDCGAEAAAVVRRLPVAVEIVDMATGRTTAVLQGVPQQ